MEDGLVFTYGYTYNRDGTRRTLAMTEQTGGTPATRNFGYAYMAGSLLERVTYLLPGGWEAASFAYDAQNRRTGLTFGAGPTATFGYDKDGRLTSLSGSTAIAHTLAYDTAGRTRTVSAPNSITHTFSYTERGFIRAMTSGSASASFYYDSTGNRVREVGEDTYTMTYRDSAGLKTNRLFERRNVDVNTKENYVYNTNGSLVRVLNNSGTIARVLNYDALQRITSDVIIPATRNRYDGLGRLIARRTGFDSEIITSYDGVNVAWHNFGVFLHGDGGPDDPLVAYTSSDNCRFVTHEGRLLGYVNSALQASCAQQSYADQSRYAGAIENSFTFGLTRAPDNTSEYNLSYFRNRWYDAKSGRFVQEDPLGPLADANLYSYAGNNPASYTDPFGLCPECEDYWLDYAASGMARGGFAGGARAAVGLAAATGLEFFGVKDLWRAGSQASEGRYAAAGGSLLLALGGVIPGERVAANFARTLKSAQGADVAVSTFGKFFRATWEVTGEGGGQSRTVWNKIINSEGKTIRMYHDSYDRAGNFMHRKFKVPDEHIAR